MPPLDKIIIATSALVLFTLEAVFLTNIRTSGYVITSKGDTVICSLKLNLNKYQLKKDNAYYQLKPDSIKEYHLTKKNKTFRAIALPDKFKPVFMQIIDTGKINLYQYFKSRGKLRTMYLIAQKGVEQPVIIYSDAHLKVEKIAFANLISDHLNASAILQNALYYNEKTISGVVKNYNGHVL